MLRYSQLSICSCWCSQVSHLQAGAAVLNKPWDASDRKVVLRDQSDRKDGLAPAHTAVAGWLLDHELVRLQPAWTHWIFDDVLLQVEMLPQAKKRHWLFSAWNKCQEMWFVKSPSLSKFSGICVSSVAEAGQMVPSTQMILNCWLFGLATCCYIWGPCLSAPLPLICSPPKELCRINPSRSAQA